VSQLLLYVEVHVVRSFLLYYLYYNVVGSINLIIYHICPVRFIYLVSSGGGNVNPPRLPEFTPVSGVRFARSTVSLVVFCRSLFVLFPCLCLFFFHLRLLIIPLVSSSFAT